MTNRTASTCSAKCLSAAGTSNDISPDSTFWQLSQLKSDCPRETLTLSEIFTLNLTHLSEYEVIHADLGPVTELPLRDNYRATKTLLRIADRHAATFTHSRAHSQGEV